MVITLAWAWLVQDIEKPSNEAIVVIEVVKILKLFMP